MQTYYYPREFVAGGWHIGIKPNLQQLDFGVIHSLQSCKSAAMFTRNNFPSWPVVLGKQNAPRGEFRTVIVNSGNANAANGTEGLELARESCQAAANALGIAPQQVLPASTGIIGQSLTAHRDSLLRACRSIPEIVTKAAFSDFAQAISTTDAFTKMDSMQLKSGIRILGVAKGAGMIAPNMATMLAFVCTDAIITMPDLQRILQVVVNRSFNRITVDSDTSTSDTVAILANGSSGISIDFPLAVAQTCASLHYPIQREDIEHIPSLSSASCEFLMALLKICVSLACMIVSDGEGATKIIELCVAKARNQEQALKIGRAILNSPLCKTAIYGCDPNWGRIIMAIGKVFDEPIAQEQLKIYFGNVLLSLQDKDGLQAISAYLQGKEIKMKIELGQGEASETLWGCDLNENYVHLNAAYSS